MLGKVLFVRNVRQNRVDFLLIDEIHFNQENGDTLVILIMMIRVVIEILQPHEPGHGELQEQP